MTNLLDETKKALRSNDKDVDDVRFVRVDSSAWFTWDEFEIVADIEYERGCGLAQIPTSLRVVGDDWWLERWEYDGAEGWKFKTKPKKEGKHEAPDSLMKD